MKLKKYRQQAQMTQFELAHLLDTSQQAISNYESGIRMPSVMKARKMLDVFRARGVDCSFEELIGQAP